jgi:predicted DNA-binding protein YlxM (UPF0122 family)
MNYPVERQSLSVNDPTWDSYDLHELYVVHDRSTQEIADIVGCYATAVRRRLRYLKLCKQKVDWENYDLPALLKTMTRKRLAEHIGITAGTLRDKLEELGLAERRKIQRQTLSRWDAAGVDLLRLANTYSYQQIADQYGVTKQAVGAAVKKRRAERARETRASLSRGSPTDDSRTIRRMMIRSRPELRAA